MASPDNAGPNSLWMVNNDTDSTIAQRGIVLISICSPIPTALTFIDYYVFDQVHTALSRVTDVAADEEPTTSSMCDSKHMTGFSFVDMTPGELGGLPVPGYESLSNGQKVRLSDFPQHFAIVAHTDDMVSMVRFFLPLHNVVVATSPFQHAMDWLHSTQKTKGSIKIRAEAFTPHVDETLLGSCEIELHIMEATATPPDDDDDDESPLHKITTTMTTTTDGMNNVVSSSSSFSCGPSVTGFRLVDGNGQSIHPDYDHLQNGQEIPSNSLPHGTHLAIHSGPNLGAVKYETEQWGDVYETNPPFHFHAKNNNQYNFHIPGKYIVKAHGYRDVDFDTWMNACEIHFQVV